METVIIKIRIMICVNFILLMAGIALAKDKADSSSAVANRFANIPVEITTGELKYRQNPEIFIKGSRLRSPRRTTACQGGQMPRPRGYGWAWNHLLTNSIILVNYYE